MTEVNQFSHKEREDKGTPLTRNEVVEMYRALKSGKAPEGEGTTKEIIMYVGVMVITWLHKRFTLMQACGEYQRR